jgi:hypothetical protein
VPWKPSGNHAPVSLGRETPAAVVNSTR